MSNNISTQHSFDTIVVGSGIAGLSAAITAQQNGDNVAIVERAPPDERGFARICMIDCRYFGVRCSSRHV